MNKKQKPKFLKNSKIAPILQYDPSHQTLLSTNLPSSKSLRETGTSSLCLSPKNIKTLGTSDFIKLRSLGSGKYGKVYLVKHIKSKFILAMKVVPKQQFESDDKLQKDKLINQFIREIKIQMFCNHPNLIKLYGFISDQINFYLLMEVGSDGQLYDIMERSGNFSEQSASILMRQVINGTMYLHSKHIIHRDIKPQNIVIVHGTAKICDFGWSVYCPKEVRSTLCGTPLYFSPQILKGKKYNEKIDSWAIGTLAFQLVTGENPFKIRTEDDMIKILTEDVQMNEGSNDFKKFITAILKKDAEQRPAALDILNLSFIQKYKQLETNQEVCLKVSRKKKYFLK